LKKLPCLQQKHSISLANGVLAAQRTEFGSD